MYIKPLFSIFQESANPLCSTEYEAESTGSILNMIVTDMRPLSIVEDKCFKKMISTFNPKYVLSPRSYCTKKMEVFFVIHLWNKYDKKKIKEHPSEDLQHCVDS